MTRAVGPNGRPLAPVGTVAADKLRVTAAASDRLLGEMPLHFLYIIGGPGAGKSTLMAALTSAAEQRIPKERPFYHDVLGCSHGPAGVELGRRRDQFAGTDALPLHVLPQVRQWLTGKPSPLVLGEGDRCASLDLWRLARETGYYTRLVVLHAAPDLLERRRAARAAATGAAPPDPAWVRGRITKVVRQAAWAEAEGFDVLQLWPAPADKLAIAVRKWAPVLGALACHGPADIPAEANGERWNERHVW